MKEIKLTDAAEHETQELIRRLDLAGAQVKALGQASWLVVVPRWMPIPVAEFDALWGTRPAERPTLMLYGKKVKAARFQRTFGADYTFSGQRSAAEELSNEGRVESIADTFGQLCHPSAKVNVGALLNFYDASLGDYVGPHSDDERALVKGTPILSVSWGQTRRFRLQRRTNPTGKPDLESLSSFELNVAHGDLVIMGGACQQTHKHELVKPNKAEKQGVGGGGAFRTKRLNATFRFFTSAQAGRGGAQTAVVNRAPPRSREDGRSAPPQAPSAQRGLNQPAASSRLADEPPAKRHAGTAPQTTLFQHAEAAAVSR